MPCKGGYRQKIEEGKRRREREREYERSPARKYWRALPDRVHNQPTGFEALQPAEKTYYAVRCLIGEVYNGGFYQYFSNSSSDLYAYAIDGLMELEATQSLNLLVQAKALLYGDKPLPVDRAAHDRLLPDIEQFSSTLRDLPSKLDALERVFWSDPDQLDERCRKFAEGHALYKGF